VRRRNRARGGPILAGMQSEAERRYLAAVTAAWDLAREIEPVAGIDRERVADLRAAVERARAAEAGVLDEMDDDGRAEVEDAVATMLGRSAAVAFAAGDADLAAVWLEAAAGARHDELQRGELEAGRRDPERHRALVHGRYLFAQRRERAARAAWKRLAGGDDGIARAAAAELRAPRPLRGAPTLWRLNGFGLGFYGERDRRPDGSYVTTHCLSALWVPLIPIGAYRVLGGNGHYRVLAREQLSSVARIARVAMAAAIAVGIAGVALYGYLHDPDGAARGRFDDAIARASAGDREAALRGLDAELTGDDLGHVDDGRAAAAGAAVVRLSASYVPTPITHDAVDQASRVVARYQGLPPRAREGAARDAMREALDGWVDELGGPDAVGDRLALLGREAEIVVDARRPDIAGRVSQARIQLADARALDEPAEALAVLTEDPSDTAAMARATPIVKRLVDAPSLLEDNLDQVATWRISVPDDDPTRAAVDAALDQAVSGRAEAERDGVTPAQLAAMQARRPWDQRVAVLLAHADLDAGRLDAAEARLRAFGTPGLMVRDARLLLGRIAAARGKLDEADQILTDLVAWRLPRFTTAAAAYQAAQRDLLADLDRRLKTGDVPQMLVEQYNAAAEADRQKLIDDWVSSMVKGDSNLTQLRQATTAYADVVPEAIAAGSVELRRAQGMSGKARDAMLTSAQRVFLAIRTEAEGQPEFDLALGEIDARLGKQAESDAELGKVLARKDPVLSLEVASVYRELGGVERAKQVAHDVYDSAASPDKERAAALLGLLAAGDDDESERWYRKADPHDPSVRISLLEIEGSRLLRQGKLAACDAKFAEAAKAYLDIGAGGATGYNNAALADGRRFLCSGDLAALRAADQAMAEAYKVAGDDPLVVGNYASILGSDRDLRVLARHIDVARLQLAPEDAAILIDALLAGSERDAVLAELAADPATRRARDLLAQFEVLAPNSTEPYSRAFAEADRRRDAAAAAAVVERARRAKALDTSEAVALRARFAAGELDAKAEQQVDTEIAQLDRVLAGAHLDRRTRAAAQFLRAIDLERRGQLRADAAPVLEAREALADVARSWPALPVDGRIAITFIDEAGLAAGGKRWGDLRHTRSAPEALANLVAAGDPLAAAIRGSQPWTQVAAHARADTTPADVDDLRLARLLGDPALEARVRAVPGDPLVRARAELAKLVSPGEAADEDLAALGPR